MKNSQPRESAMNILAILIGGMALLLQGCSYAISPAVSRTADRSVTFEQFQADPSSFKGKTVIFGGQIAQVRHAKNGTLIEVVQKELDYWGKPLRTDRTGGRFIVHQPRTLDVLVFAPGREITVAGEVTGTEEKFQSESAVLYPLINAREVKLWPREKTGWDKPQFLDPLYDPNAPQGKFGY
ncbi:MAG: Slp/YeaY family lipoprotein [Nitrospirota bacterium]